MPNVIFSGPKLFPALVLKRTIEHSTASPAHKFFPVSDGSVVLENSVKHAEQLFIALTDHTSVSFKRFRVLPTSVIDDVPLVQVTFEGNSSIEVSMKPL